MRGTFSLFPRGMVVFKSAALLLIIAGPGIAAPVFMISVDGLKPEYVLQAEHRGLKIPYLRSLLTDGTYADGVIGVWPTITYPSHTTLVTGVSPAEHGIFANLEFDPEHHFKESWFWYADQIRVPTLWHAAHAARLSTASVGFRTRDRPGSRSRDHRYEANCAIARAAPHLRQ